MISKIEALNFRSLRFIQQDLSEFQVLVGPNASGKTTFLDVPSFLGKLVSDGIDTAIQDRTAFFQDLVFRKQGLQFELAIEALVPPAIQEIIGDEECKVIRYEVQIGVQDPVAEPHILNERVLLKGVESDSTPLQRTLFPAPKPSPVSILYPKTKKGVKSIVNKVRDGNDNFYSEVRQGGSKGWVPAFKLGPRKSALANLPEDESRFPASTWLKRLLSQSVEQLVLNSLLIRKASPPGQSKGFKSDGANLPWVIARLEKESRAKFEQWISHLRTALPDIETIRTIEREDDKHRYLVVKYRGGLEIPSWMVSDGTLRMLALTLPAYLPEFSGTYLIEEPENGIHPKAVETVVQSLSSVYGAQILMATHSTIILNQVEPKSVLCFAKDETGATDIVRGNEHPQLLKWHGEKNLGTLLAAGVLG